METPETLFPVIDTIKEAWENVEGSKGTILAAFFTIIGIILLFGFVSGLADQFTHRTTLGDVIAYIGIIFVFILGWGLLYIGINRAAGQPIFYKMLTMGFDLSVLGRMIGLYILQMLILLPTVILPLSTLVIDKFLPPSTFNTILDVSIFAVWDLLMYYLVFRMILGKAVVLAQKRNPLEAIKISFKATQDYVWPIIGYTLLCAVILFLGAIPLGIGLIWTIPFVFVSYGLMYRKLVVLRGITV